MHYIMKKGFFSNTPLSPSIQPSVARRDTNASGSKDPGASPSSNPSVHPPHGYQQASSERAEDPPTSDSRPPEPRMTPEQREQMLEKCLVLLSSKRDEEKLVGLLLIARILPDADEEALVKVHAAMGPSFLGRLLLPLRKDGLTEDEARVVREKEAANKSLAISVLGGLSRVGSLARSETVLSRLHALAQVAQQGGLSSDAALSPQVHDLKAVGDALEALGNVAAGDDECAKLCFEAGALPACACALVTATSTSGRQDDTELRSAAVATGIRATRLLALMLAVMPEAVEGALCEEDGGGEPSPLAHNLVQGLAQGACATVGMRVEDLMKQQHDSPAQLQLQSVHCMQRVLSFSSAGGVVQGAAQGVLGDPVTLGRLRVALSHVLRSKSNVYIRQLGLSMVAHVTEIVGTEWLMASLDDSPAAPSNEPRGPGSFLLLLCTVLGVEVHVLLLDALSPNQPVPADGDKWMQLVFGNVLPASMSRGGEDTRNNAPDTSEPPQDGESEEAGPSMDADVPDITLQELSDVLMGAEKAQANPGESGRLPRPKLPMQLPEQAPMGKGGFTSGTTTAGERAERSFPPMAMLLEHVIQLVAESAARDEGEPGALPPQRVDELFTLTETCVGQLVDFLVETAKACGANVAPVTHPLGVMATRVVGRFLAEAPEAFSDRIPPIVPTLMAMVQGAFPDDSVRGSVFLLPYLTQLINDKPVVLEQSPGLLWSLVKFAYLPALSQRSLNDAVNAALVLIDALHHLTLSTSFTRNSVTGMIAAVTGDLEEALRGTLTAFGHLASTASSPVPDPEASNGLVALSLAATMTLNALTRVSTSLDSDVLDDVLRFAARGLLELLSTLLQLHPADDDDLMAGFHEDMAYRLDLFSETLSELLDGTADIATKVRHALSTTSGLSEDFFRRTATISVEDMERLGVAFALLRERVMAADYAN